MTLRIVRRFHLRTGYLSAPRIALTNALHPGMNGEHKIDTRSEARMNTLPSSLAVETGNIVPISGPLRGTIVGREIDRFNEALRNMPPTSLAVESGGVVCISSQPHGMIVGHGIETTNEELTDMQPSFLTVKHGSVTMSGILNEPVTVLFSG